MHKTNATSKKNLREKFRQSRNQLSPYQQKQASIQCLETFLSHKLFLQKSNIACYLAQNGEINLQPIITTLWKNSKNLFLPVVSGPTLIFKPYQQSTKLRDNQYAIPEPLTEEFVELEKLDLILMPLVAFDRLGNRLGMGGGFYDKTLQLVERKPLLVGVAHSCQQADQLLVDAWDISLDFVMTESEVFVC